MNKNTDSDDILSRIRHSPEERERVAVELLSNQSLLTGIEKVIRSKGGTKQDVESIFHLTIVSFFKKVLQDRSFVLKTNMLSYMNGIAKYLWYAELRKRKPDTVALEESNMDFSIAPGHDLLIMDNDKREVLHQILSQVGEKCKQVLLLWASGYSMQEIADQTTYGNANAIRKKKFDCMKKLSIMLAENPHLKKRLT